MKIIFKSTREKILMIFKSIEFIFRKYENINEIILFIKKCFLLYLLSISPVYQSSYLKFILIFRSSREKAEYFAENMKI